MSAANGTAKALEALEMMARMGALSAVGRLAASSRRETASGEHAESLDSTSRASCIEGPNTSQVGCAEDAGASQDSCIEGPSASQTARAASPDSCGHAAAAAGHIDSPGGSGAADAASCAESPGGVGEAAAEDSRPVGRTASAARTITPRMMEQLQQSLEHDERSRATVEKYLRDVEQFASWLASRPLEREAVAAWRESLVSMGRSASTVNGKLSSINSLLRLIGREDCRVRSLTVQRRVFRDPQRDLTREEYDRLVQVAYQARNQRIALVMEVVCACGIRVSELRNITVEAVQSGQATIRLKGKLRIVMLPDKLCCKLQAYAARNGITQGPLFVTRTGKCITRKQIWSEMKALCPQAGVAPTKVFPHNLRHLFAVEYYRIGCDIVKLADVLGHSSINTTRRYLVSTGIEHRELLNSLDLVSGFSYTTE